LFIPTSIGLVQVGKEGLFLIWFILTERKDCDEKKRRDINATMRKG
jgi:hypothetical protein